MRKVVIESPFAGNENHSTEEHIDYARKCMSDCLKRGEAPLASHLLYTQSGVLDDSVPEERTLGIQAGFTWNQLADAVVIYTDMGMSSGMKWGIENAKANGTPIEYRSLNKEG